MASVNGSVRDEAVAQTLADEKGRRPRLLLSAYSCMPYRGSEPGVGWNRALTANKVADTWVLCWSEAEKPVRGWLAEHGPVDGLRFTFIEYNRWQKILRRLPWGKWIAYRGWQRKALAVARRLHEEVRFDLAHQATFCTYREPGYLAALGVPVIWGPIGGTQNTPWRFLPTLGLLGMLREGLRSAANNVQRLGSPRIRHGLRRAAKVLAANTTVQADLRKPLGRTPDVLLETGIPRLQAAPVAPRGPNDPLRVLWVGEVKAFKGLHLLFEALAGLPTDVQWELRIIGEGPDRPRLEKLARKLGLVDRVHWLGFRPHPEVLENYENCHVFAFTSLRDTSGNVMLEALATGRPVLCLDHQGARDIVTAECGMTVTVRKPRETISELRAAIAQLAADQRLVERLSEGALRRAEDFLWTRQGAAMAEIYGSVLGRECREIETRQPIPSAIGPR